MTPTDHMRELQKAASARGVRIFRNNVGLFYTRNGTPTYCGLFVGSSDLIGWRPLPIDESMLGRVVAQFVSVEAKQGTGRPNPDQKKWLANVNRDGGLGFTARSVDDLVRALGN